MVENHPRPHYPAKGFLKPVSREVWERSRTDGTIDIVIYSPIKQGRRDVLVRRTLIVITDTEVILVEKGKGW